MRRLSRALLTAVVVCAAAPAAAQSRFEVGGGMSWTGGSDAGSGDALLSRGTPGTPLTLFATSSRVKAAAGVTARATYFITSRIAIEALAEYSRPVLRTTISNDFEQAAGTEASDRLSSYVFGGSLFYRIGHGRVAPFVVGGAGYLRQLDEDQIMLVNGSEVHAGGGITVDLAAHFAVRTDVVASSRNKSIGFEEKRRVVPVISATLAYRF